MGFVADALEEFQCAAVFWEAQRFFFAGSIDFFEFFGEAEDGDVAEAEFFEFGTGGVELAAAAVDEDQIRKIGVMEWWSGGGGEEWIDGLMD